MPFFAQFSVFSLTHPSREAVLSERSLEKPTPGNAKPLTREPGRMALGLGPVLGDFDLLDGSDQVLLQAKVLYCMPFALKAGGWLLPSAFIVFSLQRHDCNLGLIVS